MLGSLLAFLSVFAIWIERQALNTDDWVDTSGRLIQNETIRDSGQQLPRRPALRKRRRRKGTRRNPPRRHQGTRRAGLRRAAPGRRRRRRKGAGKLDRAGTLEDANRAAHEQLLAVLEDKKEAVSTEEGKVSLNLGSLITNLAGQVGIGADLAEKLPPDAGQITILRSDQLKTAQDIVVAIKGLALVLSLLTFLAFGLAIYLSREGRWVTVLFCGIGLVAAGFAVIVFREIAGGIVVDQLVNEESVKPAAEAAWSIGTSLMTSIATTVIVIGVLFGIAGWLASPTGSARSTRRVIAPALRDYLAYVYAGLAIVVGIYFLSAPTQNLRSFLTTLVIAGLAAFGIHELRKQAAEEFPDASFGDVFGRTKDRVVGAVKDANLGERRELETAPAGDAQARRRGADSEAPPTTMPTDDEDARLARLERLGLPAREGHPHRRGVRGREGPRASEPLERSAPPRAVEARQPTTRARLRDRTGNLLVTRSGALPVELGGRW